MSPLIKQYLKMFLLFGISYGVIMYLIDTLMGDTEEIMKYFLLTCFFGASMSLTLVTYQRYRLKKDGVGEIDDDNLKVNQSKTIISELSLDDIVDKLRSDSEFGKMDTSIGDGVISIKTGMTWRSWGEVIKISKDQASNEYKYTVQSSSKLKTTLIDYGKNLHNVDRVLSIIGKV